MRVRLGSESVAKREAVRRGLEPLFRDVVVDSGPVESGVAEQPLTFEEIVEGARNRARSAYANGGCDLGVGIEDGLVPVRGTRTGYVNLGCCSLYDGSEHHLGFSAGFEYPPECSAAATGPSRTPIGDAFEATFRPPAGWPAPRPGDGNIGRLTGGALTRAEYAAQAVVCAFVRLLPPEMSETERA